MNWEWKLASAWPKTGHYTFFKFKSCYLVGWIHYASERSLRTWVNVQLVKDIDKDGVFRDGIKWKNIDSAGTLEECKERVEKELDIWYNRYASKIGELSLK